MPENKARIFDALVKFGILFDYSPTKERLMIYVEHLVNYPAIEIYKALTKLKTTANKFPTLADIENILNASLNESDNANEGMARIVAALSQFGQYQAKDAREHLGSEAWFVVLGLGGWCNLCLCTHSELNTLRAQARELFKVALKRACNGTLSHATDVLTGNKKVSDMKSLESIFKKQLGIGSKSE